MTSIITRSGKGSALNHSEMDSNLDSLSGINEQRTTTSESITAADQNKTIEFTNASTITATLTLIATILGASDTTSFQVKLKNIGAGSVTVTPTTNTFDDGDTTKSLAQFEWMTIQTDNAGTSWNVLSVGITQGSGGGFDADTVDGSHAADLLARANHTGSQLLATISDVSATAAEVNKLSGITGDIVTTSDSESGSVSQSLGAVEMGAVINVAHSLGTDDVDFIANVRGSVLDLGSGSYTVVAQIMRPDGGSNMFGYLDPTNTSAPLIIAAPATGTINIRILNFRSSTQTVVVDYTITKR